MAKNEIKVKFDLDSEISRMEKIAEVNEKLSIVLNSIIAKLDSLEGLIKKNDKEKDKVVEKDKSKRDLKSDMYEIEDSIEAKQNDYIDAHSKDPKICYMGKRELKILKSYSIIHLGWATFDLSNKREVIKWNNLKIVEVKKDTYLEVG